jgi:hypothetical protein
MPEETPDEARAESAQILANEARERLQSRGFSDTQIREWADGYVTEEGSTADVEEFIDWVSTRS